MDGPRIKGEMRWFRFVVWIIELWGRTNGWVCNKLNSIYSYNFLSVSHRYWIWRPYTSAEERKDTFFCHSISTTSGPINLLVFIWNPWGLRCEKRVMTAAFWVSDTSFCDNAPKSASHQLPSNRASVLPPNQHLSLNQSQPHKHWREYHGMHLYFPNGFDWTVPVHYKQSLLKLSVSNQCSNSSLVVPSRLSIFKWNSLFFNICH